MDVRQDKDGPLENTSHGGFFFFLTLSQQKHISKYLFPLPVDCLFMQEEDRSYSKVFMFSTREKPGSGSHTGKIVQSVFFTENLSL